MTHATGIHVISGVRLASIAVGSILCIIGVAGFFSMNARVLDDTLVNGPMMASTLGIYLFVALALIAYGALAGRKPKWP